MKYSEKGPCPEFRKRAATERWPSEERKQKKEEKKILNITLKGKQSPAKGRKKSLTSTSST
jgi:hypothetical protein